MGRNKMKALAAVLLTGAIALPAMEAVADEGQFYLKLGGQRIHFDHDLDIRNDSAYTVGVGYGIRENTGLELTYARHNLETALGDDDLRQWNLDLVHSPDVTYGSNGRLSPYVVGGLGHNEYSSDVETFASFGGGLKLAINERVDWRAGARAYYGFDDDNLHFGMETALVVRLGSSSTPRRVEPTPAPAAAPAQASAPAETDTDGDGVPDSRDDCPDTPRNHRVDNRGCTIMLEEVERIDLRVQFEFDRAEVQQQFLADIRRVADFLRANPGTVAELEGHTDSVGDAAYNQGLSERRVNAVRQVLISQFGIEEGRITAVGYGESRPAESNDTPEGRASNRRVVSVVTATLQVPQTR